MQICPKWYSENQQQPLVATSTPNHYQIQLDENLLNKLKLQNINSLYGNFDINLINKYLQQSEIEIIVYLGIGVYEWSTWTCDFTREYISINADYRS